jgi:hypothetical protein
MRLSALVILTTFGAVLVISSGVLGDWSASAVGSICLEVGAALLLVPMIFWAERQIESRIEEVRKQVREGVRGLGDPGETLRLSDLWEDAHAYLERCWYSK